MKPLPYVSLSGAAAMLGVRPNTLATQIERGRLKTVPLADPSGKAYVIRVVEVERYRDEHQHKTRSTT